MITRVTAAVLLVLAAGACEERKPATTTTTTTKPTTSDTLHEMGDAAKQAGRDTKEAVKEAGRDIAEGFRALRDKAASEIDERVNRSEPDFERARKRIETLEGDARTAAQHSYDEHRTNMDKVKSRLADLRAASAEAWEDIARETRELADKTGDAIRNLADGK